MTWQLQPPDAPAANLVALIDDEAASGDISGPLAERQVQVAKACLKAIVQGGAAGPLYVHAEATGHAATSDQDSSSLSLKVSSMPTPAPTQEVPSP
jgi:hypothetical protein